MRKKINIRLGIPVSYKGSMTGLPVGLRLKFKMDVSNDTRFMICQHRSTYMIYLEMTCCAGSGVCTLIFYKF